jgi:hypothetical protein
MRPPPAPLEIASAPAPAAALLATSAPASAIALGRKLTQRAMGALLVTSLLALVPTGLNLGHDRVALSATTGIQ